MSFVLHAPNADVDLGPSMEVLAAFGEIGRVEPGDELGQLHFIPQTNEEPLTDQYLHDVSEQAQTCLDRHRDELGDGAVGVLETLAGMT